MFAQIDGMEEIKKALKNKKIAVEKIAEAVKKAGERAEQVAKEKVPKDSGELRDSIVHAYCSGGKTFMMEAKATNSKGAPYGHFVEFGTKKHGPEQPFMRPAQAAGKDVLIKECYELVKTK